MVISKNNKTRDSSATIFKSFTIFNIYVIHLAVPCIKEKFMIIPSFTDKYTDQIFSTTHLSWVNNPPLDQTITTCY